MKSAFLLPFMGPLPPYFSFWAKSCQINSDRFHWFVYNDHAKRNVRINAAVTVIPYQYGEMIEDFKRFLGIAIDESNRRMLCNYRLLYYFLRREKEDLEHYDFIGYTDMDLIYGKLSRFIPDNMNRFTMISADPGYPCGPFTLIRKDRLKALPDVPAVRQAMVAHGPYRAFDESKELLEIVADGRDFYCRPDGLQPARTPSFNHRKAFSIWEKGRVVICDSRRHREDGGFFHFSRYKDRERFTIVADADRDLSWVVYKNGIVPISSPLTIWKAWFAMLF